MIVRRFDHSAGLDGRGVTFGRFEERGQVIERVPVHEGQARLHSAVPPQYDDGATAVEDAGKTETVRPVHR
jgi:hypothetical protein